MKYFYKFAGVIALLCAMTLSVFAQNNDSLAKEFSFSRCSDFGFDVSFDSTSNVMRISMENLVPDNWPPEEVLSWNQVRFEWFGYVVTDSMPYRVYQKHNTLMAFQPNRKGEKHANISVWAKVKKAERVDNVYTYWLQLTPEQVAYLKSFNGLAGSKYISGFGPGVLHYSTRL